MVGGCVSHVMENGEKESLAFTSQTLPAAERKYAQIEKEALAIVFAVR